MNGCVESALKTAAATTTTGVAGGSESWEAFQSQLKSDLSSASVSTVLTQCAPMLAAAFDIQAIMLMSEATAALYEDVAVIPESILLAPDAFDLGEAYTYGEAS